MKTSPVEITVAVPVKDRREQMRRCLTALLDQDHPNYEVLVLDNDSSDGTAEACREIAAESQVSVRVETVSGSVGVVRNLGAQRAHGEFLAFTDSDCVADRGWLSAITRAFRADPRVGVVCGPTHPESAVVAGWPATIEVRSWSGRFESCNVAFRTAPFRDSEGFDEVVGHFWEDTAAGYAMLRLGWRTAFAPDALVLHDVTYPGFAWHMRRALKMRNLGPVLVRYPEAAELLYLGIFVRRRDAKLVAWVAGLALAVASRSPIPLALSLPYTSERLRHWRDPKSLAQALLYDGACVAGAARAGLTAHRLIL